MRRCSRVLAAGVHASSPTRRRLHTTTRTGGGDVGAALDFPKYYEKSALLAKKRKFPETYHELQLIREEIRNFREMYCVRTTAVSRRVRDAGRRKLVFHKKGQTPPGHWPGASWEEHFHMGKATGKRRGPFWPDDEDPSAGTV